MFKFHWYLQMLEPICRGTCKIAQITRITHAGTPHSDFFYDFLRLNFRGDVQMLREKITSPIHRMTFVSSSSMAMCKCLNQFAKGQEPVQNCLVGMHLWDIFHDFLTFHFQGNVQILLGEIICRFHGMIFVCSSSIGIC